jgi:hypothetical protein
MAFHRPLAASTFNQSLQGGAGHALQKGIHPTHRVEIFVDSLGGVGQRRTILKLQGADGCFDFVWG